MYAFKQIKNTCIANLNVLQIHLGSVKMKIQTCSVLILTW